MAKTFKFNESLSVLIPAFNEESNIERVVKQAIGDAEKISHNFEVVIVNDGSVDKTGQILDKLAKKDSRIRVIHHPKNQGLGKALQTGVKVCRKDVIIYIEADGQSLLRDQHELLKKIKNADIVLGSRSGRPDYSFFRKVLSYGYLFIFWLLFSKRFKDLLWSQAYRRKIFNKIKMKSPTPFFTTEVVIKALREGFKVAEAPTLYRPRMGGKTSLGNIKTAYRMFKEMLKLRFGLLD